MKNLTNLLLLAGHNAVKIGELEISIYTEIWKMFAYF